jgi:hypothetical protein
MADTDTAVILASMQDQLDDLTATAAGQQQIDELLRLVNAPRSAADAPRRRP